MKPVVIPVRLTENMDGKNGGFQACVAGVNSGRGNSIARGGFLLFTLVLVSASLILEFLFLY